MRGGLDQQVHLLALRVHGGRRDGLQLSPAYSTQLMMVAAFGGYDCVMNAYKIAREEGYRFGTYGDAMLLL